MLDELQRLRESDSLLQLLTHYATQNHSSPETWLDRLMQIDGAEVHDLVRWHGELIAFGWIDQNTGHVSAYCAAGVLRSCYRVTSAGKRALRDARADDATMDAEGENNYPIESTAPAPPRRRSESRRKKSAAKNPCDTELVSATDIQIATESAPV